MTATDDRTKILFRAKSSRAVKRPDAHLTTPEHVTIGDIPDPYDPRGEGALDDQEQDHLRVCEQAIAQVQQTLATAGKALTVISMAKLYREKYKTFEAYVIDRWGIKRSHAYRMMEAWPIAVALSPIGDTNEGQLRELVPVAKRHGVETAAAVYAEIHQRTGGHVTAKRLQCAVRTLPPTLDNPDQAREVIHRALESGKLGLDIPTQTDLPAHGPPDHTATRAVASLEEILAQQRLAYDRLGDGLADEALLAEPKRAAYLLREIARYSRRIAHRTERSKTEE